MKLYHYTASSLGEAILSDAISQGHLMHSDGTMSQGVAWLTTDPSADGHGLTLGTEKMDSSAIAHQERVAGARVRNNRTLDKTQLRLTVELDPDATPWLMSFLDYCKANEPKAWAKTFGPSCLTDLRTTSEKELKRLLRYATTKEATWWLSFRAVPTERIVAVDFNLGGQFVPYDFELHGREALRSLGFVFPGKAALDEVAELLPSAHAFERPKAFVICEDSTKPAKVAIRGGGTVRGFEVVGAQPVVGELDATGSALQTWVKRREAELMACWTEAAELYYDTYPERRPAVSCTEHA